MVGRVGYFIKLINVRCQPFPNKFALIKFRCLQKQKLRVVFFKQKIKILLTKNYYLSLFLLRFLQYAVTFSAPTTSRCKSRQKQLFNSSLYQNIIYEFYTV